MKPKSIGIIGGAGPLAGAFLLERVLSISNKTYGCYRDSDFPKIFLISFPFSEMLSPTINTAKLRDELWRGGGVRPDPD
jgi:aspartate racemase